MKRSTPKLVFLAVFASACVAWMAPQAQADTVDDAVTAAMQGDTDQAHTLLVDVIETQSSAARDLARAGWWALQLGDLDLLQRLRAVAEQREGAGTDGMDPAERVELVRALGYAYLGTAEVSLRQGGGSSVALLFADAAARAEELAPVAPAGAAWLTARTLWAQGDSNGALASLESYRTQGGARDAVLDALEATLRYERGVAAGTTPEGAATENAAKDLRAAVAGLPAPTTLPFLPARRQRMMLTRAWAQHRLWASEAAHEDYMGAYALAPDDRRFIIQGLQSLHAHDAKRLTASLQALAEAAPRDTVALDVLMATGSKAGDMATALGALAQRLERAPKDVLGWIRGGDLFAEQQQWTEALRHYTQALKVDPGSDAASFGMESVARAVSATDFDRCLAIYESLLKLRPTDPYSRNNMGFLLREAVSPWTTMGPGQVQTLRDDAPAQIPGLLERCREVYAEATALIPEEDDESRDMDLSWNLAGIVNDYALMIHYFADIQDVDKAERLYWRVLRMTDGGFKDTYAPNLQRLYATLRPGRLMSWYQAARRCKDAIKREVLEDGKMRLVDDPRKQAAAAQDEGRLRARIVLLLKEHAEEDEAPWPPAASEPTDD